MSGSWVWVRLAGVVRGIGLDDPVGSRAEFIPRGTEEVDVAVGGSLATIGSDLVEVRDGRTGLVRHRFAAPRDARFGASDDRWLWFTAGSDEDRHAIAVDEFGVSGPVVELPAGATVRDACDGLLLCRRYAFHDVEDITVVDLEGAVRFERRVMDAEAVLGPGVLHIAMGSSEMEAVPLLGQVLSLARAPAPRLDKTMFLPGFRRSAVPTPTGRLELWQVTVTEQAKTLPGRGPFRTVETTQEVESYVVNVAGPLSRSLVLPFESVGIIAADDLIVVVASDPTRRDGRLEPAGPVALHLFDLDLSPAGRVAVGAEPLRGRPVVITTAG